MKSIFRIFSKRSTLFLLLFYITLSIILISMNKPSTLRGVRVTVLQMVSWLNAVEDRINTLENLRLENKQLHKENLEYSMTNQRLQEIMLENQRLRRLLQLKKQSHHKYMAANVIGFGQEATVRSLILDAGRSDSLQKNMPVLTDRGLVGKILEVESGYSIAQILMDRNSLVSARLQQSREIGVIGWSGNIWLDLNYIPKNVPVEPGEIVITSGLSKIYPAGLKIGVVGEVEVNEYELFKEIKVKPAVNFNNLEEVFVLVKPDTTLSRENKSE